MIKNVRKVVVTDADGNETTFEGEAGYAQIYTKSKLGQPYQRGLDVHLQFPPQPDVKA